MQRNFGQFNVSACFGRLHESQLRVVQKTLDWFQRFDYLPLRKRKGFATYTRWHLIGPYISSRGIYANTISSDRNPLLCAHKASLQGTMGTGNLAESSSRSAAKLVAFDSRPRNFSKRYKSLVGHHCRQGTLTIEFTLAQPSYNNGSAGMTTLSNSEIGDIVETVIHCDQLKLPARLSRAPLSSVDRRQYLLALLQHDAGVFLERHGRLIDSKQRAYFQPLAAESYEVDFYLKLLEDEELNSTNQVKQALSES